MKVGEYFVDKDGNIEVTFTANQLSPVVVFKNGKTQSEVENQVDSVSNSIVNNDDLYQEIGSVTSAYDKISISERNSLEIEKAPATGDEINMYILGSVFFLL